MLVLQLGYFNWAEKYEIPEEINWLFSTPEAIPELIERIEDEEDELELRSFSALVLDDSFNITSLHDLKKYIEPYTVLYNEQTPITPDSQTLAQLLQARPVSMEKPEELIYLISRSFYGGQYGDKLRPNMISVHHSFQGKYELDGGQFVRLSGYFGEDFRSLVSWRYNKLVYTNSASELWLEYEKIGNCEIRVHLQLLTSGNLGQIFEERVYTEEDLKEAMIVDIPNDAYLSFRIEARGSGELKIGNLHQRMSRYQFGKFILGGEILKDSKRQELIAYFHPGDMKPPLNVYFSGFRPAEGFEGFYMMRSLGAPFILFGDPRLEGGSFYLGSEELEKQVTDFIQKHLDLLGFDNRELTLAGLSMGTFGALYYGSDFNPDLIVVGKPLVNLGDIAKNLKLKRPDEFATSLDMMRLIIGENSEKGIELLNHRFWEKFEQADFTDTTLALAYMRDDDYDQNAYSDILERLYDTPIRIISKSRPGRHNDASAPIIEWFLTQYKEHLQRKYGRKYG
ncbi:Accessory secretory protein Asp2 [Streptococcus sp. DD10]|nr:Accessory secretory protein Asp2 [Streptococcus sp. DD10]